ncbi:hypothetical protein JW916_01830 [Candidatus Sumerlaeota bacterium]|nr:hypothetical protein [Candidatus Sumerlaeota bacterium]
MMALEKFSMGVGDRFGRQGKAQLAAFKLAKESGVDIVPVWNKSHREHTIVKTTPDAVRAEADEAVRAGDWKGPYHVDADHIGLKNVDLFIASSDFFTLDVADFIDEAPETADLDAFVKKQSKYLGYLEIPGIDQEFEVSRTWLEQIGRRFLLAVKEAGKIYRHVLSAKGSDDFITEVSVDESKAPQTPVEMFFILAMVADEGIPAQTIAPKFTGRFNKGVDYAGDIKQFAKEFDEDVAVISFAVREFGLPANLKLSVHSGSDKFSIYKPIRETLQRTGAGLHLKTAGTTWLEEIIGLAEAGGDGLAIAKEVYRTAFGRFDELCAPYAPVIDIDKRALPSAETVDKWTSEQFTHALRHDLACEHYNSNVRQLLHVGYKVAAEMGARYLDALDAHEAIVARNVLENIYERHMKRVFIGE